MALSTIMVMLLIAVLLSIKNSLGQQNGYINPIWLESERLAEAISKKQKSTNRESGAGSPTNYRPDAEYLTRPPSVNQYGESGAGSPTNYRPDAEYLTRPPSVNQYDLRFNGGLQNFASELAFRYFQEREQQEQQLFNDVTEQRQLFYDRQQPPLPPLTPLSSPPRPPLITDTEEDIFKLGSRPLISRQPLNSQL